MADVRLYSAQVCPFCQRTHLVLLEKGIEYEVSEIDLKNIPDWFLRLSPYGKVPLLEKGEERIWESSVINEYLDEIEPNPPLMPSAPGQRARVRIWVNYANDRFLPLFYKLLLEQEPQWQNKLAGMLRARLRHMDQEGPGRPGAGPYWMGAQPTLADMAFYPFFERFPVLEHYRDFTLQRDQHRHLIRWLEAMAARPSVQASRNPPDYYIERYASYADGTAAGSTAREMRGED